ncbi:NAD(P)/FAD-dependent oxidoreductase [Butyrivibrio sp. MC2013]|uniref:NAD(P)/FAD-dependent oxidoreductase n=1 Tax=Butyrivibrio sp. MC2013 TaxID=1280686 RepID=UPI00040B2E62|nr:hypothetical protein [Butyrivibrio sp. MC2013]
MIKISDIKIVNDTDKEAYINGVGDPAALERFLVKYAAGELRCPAKDIRSLKVLKHSIDARKKPDIVDIYAVAVELSATEGMEPAKARSIEEKLIKKSRNKKALIYEEKRYVFPSGGDRAMTQRPVVAGMGPGGLFAAYELALHGYRPIVIERGRCVEDRGADVERFWNTGVLDPESNVQFGEGGAGAFSDGKLNTLVKDKDGRGAHALEVFVASGAPKEILYESKPHIGTDKLVTVVRNMRREIIDRGGEVFFETRLTELIKGEDGRLTGIKVADKDGERVIGTSQLILAIGHSARDTFEELHKEKILMEPKAFAVGLRVEHRQSDIDMSQYGRQRGESLPAAPYKLVHNTSEGRGVYSFCMCPGGHVVNASSEEGRLCVNGMSYYARDSRNANSAIIVTISPEDYGDGSVLSGVAFQREIERRAYLAGGGAIPVEYYKDFKDGSQAPLSYEEEGRQDWNRPCCKGNCSFSDVRSILPEYINRSLIEGIERFGSIIKGYNKDDVLLEGVEARTSSPVRILRDEKMVSPSLKGLYPCGEGAGYAGGIMSAAMDGIKVAAAIAEEYHPAF